MTALVWDQVSERLYETGVDRGVLYIPDNTGAYIDGFAWNGLTAVTESPEGAEATATYADNLLYLNLISLEKFKATIEAYTYPDEFMQCDGMLEADGGVLVGQQPRKSFGLSYRTRLGNDTTGTEHGYKLHMVYGLTASPSEKAYKTINDSPEAITFSWDVHAVPIEVPGFKPASLLTITSTDVDSAALATLEGFLYGTVGTDPSLPTPTDLLAIFSGTVTTTSLPTAPTYDSGTDNVTIPVITGVNYYHNGVLVTGTVHITSSQVFTARPATGYKFPTPSVDEWLIVFS